MGVTLPTDNAARKAELDRLRARFKSAIALERTTAKSWARQEGGVSEQQLYAVLKGDRESETLLGKIRAFVARAHSEAIGEAP